MIYIQLYSLFLVEKNDNRKIHTHAHTEHKSFIAHIPLLRATSALCVVENMLEFFSMMLPAVFPYHILSRDN